MKSFFSFRLTHIMLVCALAGTALMTSGCGFGNPTDVQNPQITDETFFANAGGSVRGLLVGLRQRQASAVARTSLMAEAVSDNYDNITSFVSADLDFPRAILNVNLTLNGTDNIYFQCQQYQAFALYGLNSIVPVDALATNVQRGEVHFHRGYGLLLLSENFSAFPIVDQGIPLTAADARKIAIGHFRTSLTFIPATAGTADDIALRQRANFALARAYRSEGNKDSATFFANQAVTLGGTSYVANTTYDAAQFSNNFAQFTAIRSDNAFQPNPRLDFLDPKFTALDTPIPIFKAEEPQLILAEIALSNNNLAAARTAMEQAVTIARSRALVPYLDIDGRPTRPNQSNAIVRADANSPFISGLVARRSRSTVNLYAVSFTNQTADSVRALATRPLADHVYMLYLLRQHIFFGEGRRMNDLRIQLPVMLRQSEANPNMPEGSPGTVVVVPSYIPADDEMDAFTLNTTVTPNQVSMRWDLNRIIVNNIRAVSPFSGF